MPIVRPMLAALLLSATAAQAQAPAGNGPAPVTAPTDPLALPGDFMDIPQSAQLRVGLGPPAGKQGGGPPPARPDTTPSPGFALALEAANAALAACKADGFTVAVAVTDAAGKLKVAFAPDGTRTNGVYMALRKDVTAAAFKMSTLALREKIAADPSLLAQVKPNMSLLPGGLPIMAGGRVVGAISTSGATAHVEEKCAQAGIDAIQSQLQ